MQTFLAKAALGLTALLVGFAPQQAAKAPRAYKVDESGGVQIEVTAETGGGKIDASGSVIYKVTKVLEGNRATVHMDLKDLKILMNGGDIPMEVDGIDTTLDGMGMPDTWPLNQAEAIYSLAALGWLSPEIPAKANEAVDFKWSNEKKTATIKGKVRLAASEETGGVKTSKVAMELELVSDQDSTPVKVTQTSWIDEKGNVVRSEGTLSAPDGTEVAYKVKPIKAKAGGL
ncbi:MAG: hypothetical protein HZC36_08700 [Armatimonadetes bacterium]|nr:hypothetical protein [Armatimonadota bacterium]